MGQPGVRNRETGPDCYVHFLTKAWFPHLCTVDACPTNPAQWMRGSINIPAQSCLSSLHTEGIWESSGHLCLVVSLTDLTVRYLLITYSVQRNKKEYWGLQRWKWYSSCPQDQQPYSRQWALVGHHQPVRNVPSWDITSRLEAMCCHSTHTELVLREACSQVLALSGKSCHMHEPQFPYR